MAYTRSYKIEHLNFNGIACHATFYDAYSFVPGVGLYSPKLINGAGNPVAIAAMDDNENKFSPIKAKRCTILFNSSNSFNLSTFIEGEDNRWIVQVWAGNWIIFDGFLVMDDCREPFMPHPNVVTLTAIDGLGTLKETPLTDFAGKNPKGKYRIIEYLAMALAKTGLQLEIRLIHNLVEEHSAANVPCYLDNYLDAKTFEGEEIGTSTNCYEVIRKILGYDAFIQQHNNRWWIIRIDEMQGAAMYPHRFTWKGEFIQSENPITLNSEIGALRDMKFIHGDAVVMLMRKHKSDKLTFNYNLPKELIDNQDFTRGNWLTPVIINDKVVDGVTLKGSAYNLEDWTALRGTFAAPQTAIGTKYIIRYHEDGVEKERFVQLSTTSTANQWIQSSAVPVHSQDKIDFKIDLRFPDKAGILGFNQVFAIQIILVGDNGTTYCVVGDPKAAILGGGPPVKWEVYTGDLRQSVNTVIAEAQNVFTTAETREAIPPVPVTGDLYFLLPFVVKERVDYQNLQFKYTPYINGSYRDYKGQFNKTEVEGTYKAVTDDEVYISDSPKKLFKGALYRKDNNNKFVLTGNYYNAAVFRTKPTFEYFHPFGYTQIYAVHNQYNRTFRMLTGSVQNMNTSSADNIPDSTRQFKIAEDGDTLGRVFMLASFSQNLRLEEWSATLIEVYANEGKEYAAKHEFKYI